MDGIINKAATTEVAQIASKGVATVIGEALLKKDDNKPDVVKGTDPKSIIEQVTGSKTQRESSTAILRNLMEKLAIAGISLEDVNSVDKAGIKLQGNGDMLDVKEDVSTGANDVISISSKSLKRSYKESVAALKFNLNIDYNESDPAKKNMLKEYATQYYSFLVSDDPKAKQKLQKTEAQLKEAGVSDDKMFSAAKQVRNAVRSDISLKLKENMLFNELSDSPIDKMINSVGINSLIKSAVLGEKFGSLDAANEILDQTVNQAKNDNADEVQKYVLEEVESRLIEKSVKGEKNVDDMDKLLDLTLKSELDLSKWIDEVWVKRKQDLGFTKADIALPVPSNTVDTNTDNPGGGKGSRDEDENISTDEAEIMSNQLRALYTQRIIKGDVATRVKTMFKIMKLKNGLMKLGVYNKDFDEKIGFESEVIAKKKLIDMIKEAILEKATLFKTKGAAFDLVENKLKGHLETAKRLNIEITKEELDRMQYNADSRILDVVKEQVKAYAPYIKKSKNMKMIKTYKKLASLQNRLMEATTVKGKPFAEEDLASEVI